MVGVMAMKPPCTAFTESDRDWGAWLSAMDGAKVTTYVTNNGDGTADVKAVMVGNDGEYLHPGVCRYQYHPDPR